MRRLARRRSLVGPACRRSRLLQWLLAAHGAATASLRQSALLGRRPRSRRRSKFTLVSHGYHCRRGAAARGHRRVARRQARPRADRRRRNAFAARRVRCEIGWGDEGFYRSAAPPSSARVAPVAACAARAAARRAMRRCCTCQAWAITPRRGRFRMPTSSRIELSSEGFARLLDRARRELRPWHAAVRCRRTLGRPLRTRACSIRGVEIVPHLQCAAITGSRGLLSAAGIATAPVLATCRRACSSICGWRAGLSSSLLELTGPRRTLHRGIDAFSWLMIATREAAMADEARNVEILKAGLSPLEREQGPAASTSG